MYYFKLLCHIFINFHYESHNLFSIMFIKQLRKNTAEHISKRFYFFYFKRFWCGIAQIISFSVIFRDIFLQLYGWITKSSVENKTMISEKRYFWKLRLKVLFLHIFHNLDCYGIIYSFLGLLIGKLISSQLISYKFQSLFLWQRLKHLS